MRTIEQQRLHAGSQESCQSQWTALAGPASTWWFEFTDVFLHIGPRAGNAFGEN